MAYYQLIKDCRPTLREACTYAHTLTQPYLLVSLGLPIGQWANYA